MEPIRVVVLPLAVGTAISLVIALSMLYQRYRFRRTGDAPVFAPGHVLAYGAASAASSALAEVWNPPLWQKLLILGIGIGLAWLAFRSARHPLMRRLERAISPVAPVSSGAYLRGRAAAAWLLRQLRRVSWLDR